MNSKNYYLVQDSRCEYFIPLKCHICDAKRNLGYLCLFSAEELKQMNSLQICQFREIMNLDRHTFLCQTCCKTLEECCYNIERMKLELYEDNKRLRLQNKCFLCQCRHTVHSHSIASDLEYNLVCNLIKKPFVEGVVSICINCEEVLMKLLNLHQLYFSTQAKRNACKRGWKQTLSFNYTDYTSINLKDSPKYTSINLKNNCKSYTKEELLAFMPPRNSMTQVVQDLTRLSSIVQDTSPIVLNETEISYINHRDKLFKNWWYEPIHPTDIPQDETTAMLSSNLPFGVLELGSSANNSENTNSNVKIYYANWWDNLASSTDATISNTEFVSTEQTQGCHININSDIELISDAPLGNQEKNFIREMITYNPNYGYSTMSHRNSIAEEPQLESTNSNIDSNICAENISNGNTEIESPTCSTYKHLQEQQVMPDFITKFFFHDSDFISTTHNELLLSNNVIKITSTSNDSQVTDECQNSKDTCESNSTKNNNNSTEHVISTDITCSEPSTLNIDDSQPDLANETETIGTSVITEDLPTTSKRSSERLEDHYYSKHNSSNIPSSNNFLQRDMNLEYKFNAFDFTDYMEFMDISHIPRAFYLNENDIFDTQTKVIDSYSVDEEYNNFFTNPEFYTPRVFFIDEAEIVAILQLEMSLVDSDSNLDTEEANSSTACDTSEEGGPAINKQLLGSASHDKQPGLEQ